MIPRLDVAEPLKNYAETPSSIAAAPEARTPGPPDILLSEAFGFALPGHNFECLSSCMHAWHCPVTYLP